MTERLYYRDPALLVFDAVVTRVESAEERLLVYLNRSAFYPTSGGQSHDLGSLNEHAVVDVIEDSDRDIAHALVGASFAIGDEVHGEVEARRRLKNRRQHTAQHILSQLFVQKFGAETVSVHLGEDYGAIELEVGTVGEEALREIEREANTIVATNLPIKIVFATGDEISRLPLRKPPQREGMIRVIQIGDLDWSACGGTHCNSTAEVGIVKIIGTEKIRGHALVRFLVGEQALEDYGMRLEVTDTLAKALTCHPTDLPTKVEKLMSENKNLRRELSLLQKEQLPARARELAAKRLTAGKTMLVSEEVAEIDPGLLGMLASQTAEEINGVALLMNGQRVVIATAASAGVAADQLARSLSQKVGLKGGGNARMAQLGGADPQQFREYRDALIALVENA